MGTGGVSRVYFYCRVVGNVAGMASSCSERDVFRHCSEGERPGPARTYSQAAVARIFREALRGMGIMKASGLLSSRNNAQSDQRWRSYKIRQAPRLIPSKHSCFPVCESFISAASASPSKAVCIGISSRTDFMGANTVLKCQINLSTSCGRKRSISGIFPLIGRKFSRYCAQSSRPKSIRLFLKLTGEKLS